ncbi:MAG TPA: alcohol dehydrogenase [Acidobacteriaceae bacterium]|jgi:D-arabinose 1-dehydrogenase-like Zn-dependent alcohol dehydrogenase|nr:alcohol dehydrogenase [Acidobacteriaceae bacterium]
MPTVSGRAFQVTSAGGPFELVQREFPDPGPGQVRFRVQACGVCHSDTVTKFGIFPNIAYPRVPGHEVAGVIDAVGADVPVFKTGQRVGLGWHGGHCNYCSQCRRGEFILCENQKISGISYDGGYADYVIAPANALALIPDDLSDVDAAPLMCAGVTTFNSLRNAGARLGDTVAILGMGGLGHLGVQFAAKGGFNTVAIARGADKAPLAKELGAHHYIDSTTQDFTAELQKLGGADVILSTLTDPGAMSAAVMGLAPQGKLVLLGVPDKPLELNSLPMILGERTVAGWPSGTGMDSQDTLEFSALTGVKPKIELYSLDQAPEAFDRMMSGKALFRVVITTGA